MTAIVRLETLALEMSEKYDIELQAARVDVASYHEQIADDDALSAYDEDNGFAVTEEGAEIIRAQMATVYETGNFEQQAQDALARLDEASTRVKALDAALEDRDTAIRHALSIGLPVRVVVQHTELSRGRVYQIRDGRR
jgi:hypothetical protein